MYLVVGDDGIYDSDMALLVQILSVLDNELESIAQEAVELPDPDAFGLFDRSEHITGLGFVACQAYMTATYGFIHLPKARALQIGPRHIPSGRFLVNVINHAANFWKHHPEWPLYKNEARKQKVRDAFDDIGFPVDTDYPLSGILTGLTTPEEARFCVLTKGLGQWRDAIEQERAQQLPERDK